MEAGTLFGEITAIQPELINTEDRLRPVDPAHVEGIAASIAQIGLRQPILVRPHGNHYRLVAGAHRLAAIQKLGHTTIDAIIENVDDDEARLIEIDENLMRRELSALDRAIFLAERKAVYDVLYPETVKPGRRKKELATSCRQFGETFSKATANRLGLSKKTVERSLALAASLSPEAREALRLSDLADNQSELLKLAALEPEKQVSIAHEIAAGRAKNPKAARVALGFDVLVPQDPQEVLFASFLALYARADQRTKARIADHIAGTNKKVAKGGKAELSA